MMLIEKLLLIAHHPNSARFLVDHTLLDYSITGALFLELAANEQFQIINKKLHLDNHAQASTVYTRDLMMRIRKANNTRQLLYWIQILAPRAYKYRNRIMKELVRKKQITYVHKKFMGLFSYKLHYLTNLQNRQEIVDDIRNKIHGNQPINQQDIQLIALINTCKLHRKIARDSSESKIIKKRIKIILEQQCDNYLINEVVHATHKAISHAQASTAAAVS